MGMKVLVLRAEQGQLLWLFSKPILASARQYGSRSCCLSEEGCVAPHHQASSIHLAQGHCPPSSTL